MPAPRAPRDWVGESSVPPDGSGHLAFLLRETAAVSLQTLPSTNYNEVLARQRHTYTSKEVKREANCSNCPAARNFTKVCLMPGLLANSLRGSHTPQHLLLGGLSN